MFSPNRHDHNFVKISVAFFVKISFVKCRIFFYFTKNKSFQNSFEGTKTLQAGFDNHCIGCYAGSFVLESMHCNDGLILILITKTPLQSLLLDGETFKPRKWKKRQKGGKYLPKKSNKMSLRHSLKVTPNKFLVKKVFPAI